MPKLSQLLQEAAAFFESVVDPTAAEQAASAANQLKLAAATAEAVLPAVVNDVVNYGMSKIPGASTFTSDADEYIDRIIAAFTAKKSAPAS